MVAWVLRDFGGQIPRREPRLLPDNAAEQAVNCDLAAGNLAGLPIPELIQDLSAFVGTQRAYRFPLANNPDAWLALPSPFSSVCRSPLANDTAHRLYWTNPPGSSPAGAFWNTYTRIAAGNAGANAPYNMGTIQPGSETGVGFPTGAPTVGSSGGTATPLIARSYCWTYVNQYGEESAPSLPSSTVTGHSDGTWTVTGMPTSAPGNPGGFNYPPITGVNLYRTSTGTNTGAQFYQVAQFVYGVNSPTSPYTDTVPDTTAVNNLTLISASWGNPPSGLDGLVALPGGMLVGFTDNTLHFCEVDRPHTWPAGYDQSVQYPIVGLTVWQQSLMVLTTGFPSTGSGNSPSNYVLTTVRVPEPCISRGSIITDLMGTYYASQNGLVTLNYFGMQNQTLSNVTKNIWLNRFKANNIIACRHRAQFLALKLDGSNSGFIIDYTEQRMGMMDVSTFSQATAIWNDEYTGDTYICAAGKVYRWDSQNTGPLTYRWRSRQFYGPMPISLGACQVALDSSVLNPAPVPNTQTLGNGDSTLVLPSGVNAVISIYAGTDHAYPTFTRNLRNPREIFALPSGFKAFDWQVEIVSRVPVHSIELATTMRELTGV